MTTPIELWESAASSFDARHQLLTDEHLGNATPCPEFDVAALIEHAVGTQVALGRKLGGTAVDGASWADARAAMVEALAAPGSVDGIMQDDFLGEVPRERVLAIATNDLLIHSWDLARALGVDETLPEQNLQPAIDGILAFPEDLRAKLFGNPIDVAADASAQEQMLAVAGRAT